MDTDAEVRAGDCFARGLEAEANVLAPARALDFAREVALLELEGLLDLLHFPLFLVKVGEKIYTPPRTVASLHHINQRLMRTNGNNVYRNRSNFAHFSLLEKSIKVQAKNDLGHIEGEDADQVHCSNAGNRVQEHPHIFQKR